MQSLSWKYVLVILLVLFQLIKHEIEVKHISINKRKWWKSDYSVFCVRKFWYQNVCFQVSFFTKKLIELKQEKGSVCKYMSIPNNTLLASYRVAKCRKVHAIAEQLILPAAVDLVNIMSSESVGKLLSIISLGRLSIYN